MSSHGEILDEVYSQALAETAQDDYSTELSPEIQEYVKCLVSRSETNKGIIAVIITLLTHKIFDSNQDIRYHQAQLQGGFAGRGVDQNHVTPFMKKVGFPAMAESGWLTRSLEQPHPYTMDYPGKISPLIVKSAFLTIIDQVQVQGVSPQSVLLYIFKLLIEQRDNEQKMDLAKPHSLSISNIVKVLEKHFTYHYSCAGASRLPTLAIYVAYQCMMTQVARYNNKELCSLASHNSADMQSGRIGDIDVDNADGTAFEGVEIKHEKMITPQLVVDAYEKFKVYNTDRYYMLTTANMENADWNAIEAEIQKISRIHGCQVIVNGVYSSLKYYLRLLSDPAEFVEKYVDLLKTDETVKYPHKAAWNEIISHVK